MHSQMNRFSSLRINKTEEEDVNDSCVQDGNEQTTSPIQPEDASTPKQMTKQQKTRRKRSRGEMKSNFDRRKRAKYEAGKMHQNEAVVWNGSVIVTALRRITTLLEEQIAIQAVKSMWCTSEQDKKDKQDFMPFIVQKQLKRFRETTAEKIVLVPIKQPHTMGETTPLPDELAENQALLCREPPPPPTPLSLPGTKCPEG